jgi:hypothetical protein
MSEIDLKILQNRPNESRGLVERILVVVKYPDGETLAVPLNARDVKSFLFSHNRIETEFGGDPNFDNIWNDKNWVNNPSFVISFDKPEFDMFYCQKTGHNHPNKTCVSLVQSEKIAKKIPGSANIKSRMKRGELKHLVIYCSYNGNDTCVWTIDPTDIEEIICSHEEIEKRLGTNRDFWSQWNSGDWTNNPSFCLVLANRTDSNVLMGRRNDRDFKDNSKITSAIGGLK